MALYVMDAWHIDPVGKLAACGYHLDKKRYDPDTRLHAS